MKQCSSSERRSCIAEQTIGTHRWESLVKESGRFS